jgi:hypothetical protein
MSFSLSMVPKTTTCIRKGAFDACFFKNLTKIR